MFQKRPIHVNNEMYPFPPPLELIETRAVLKQLTASRAALAELKGVAATIPNQQIFIDTLVLQEAKHSSSIENIITTHDEVYRSDFDEKLFASQAAKEVIFYAQAVKQGHLKLKESGNIRINDILKVQEVIEGNRAGIRAVPGTVLKNDITGEVVYTPPQEKQLILKLLGEMERFINDSKGYDTDPLIKMALIHHRFESIHPFYDGNGRTGRILNLLYLIHQNLLEIPILYLSRYINSMRQEYYRLLQVVRTENAWEEWSLYMLRSVEVTAISTIDLVQRIKLLMQNYKQKIRTAEPRMYSQDLINNIFRHPYTRISYLERELKVSRQTASTYLNRLVEMRLLAKIKMGRMNFYVNREFFGY